MHNQANLTHKLSPYQEYRSKAKSEIDCSLLLQGLNEVDSKMKQYDQIRNRRLSLSDLDDLTAVQSNHPSVSNIQFRDKKPQTYKQLASDRGINIPLMPISEYQGNRTKIPKPMIGSRMTSSTVMVKGVPGRTNTKNLTVKGELLNKGNTISNEKQVKSEVEKKMTLRIKTKQLQQQLLQAFGGDHNKITVLNKQFNTILKLLE